MLSQVCYVFHDMKKFTFVEHFGDAFVAECLFFHDFANMIDLHQICMIFENTSTLAVGTIYVDQICILQQPINLADIITSIILIDISII